MGQNAKPQTGNWRVKGHARLKFPMGLRCRGFAPLLLSQIGAEIPFRSGRIPAPAQELLGRSVIRGQVIRDQVIRDLLGNLLQNRFELGPLGSIGVNPGQFRVGVDAAGVPLSGTIAAVSAARKSARSLLRLR